MVTLMSSILVPGPGPGELLSPIMILRVGKPGKAACHSEHASRPISLDHHMDGEHLKLAGPGAAVATRAHGPTPASGSS
jgi:hypothetical protein